MGKLGGVVVCLVVAIVFGGVGVFASWGIVTTLRDAYRAQDWVRVKADVDAASLVTSQGSSGAVTAQVDGRYRYTFEGRQYAGTRLGISTVGGSDNLDDWQDRVNARLEQARATGTPVTVWVNPENPSEAVFNREIRWSEIVFLVPFALAFGGVGVGALVVMGFILRARSKGGAQQAILNSLGAREKSAAADGSSGAGFLWIFAFFWNALAFPMAYLVVVDVVQSGEWMGLLVLLFPLVGVGLLAAAFSLTWKAWRERFGIGTKPAAKPTAVPAARTAARTAARPAAGNPGAFAAAASRAMFESDAGGLQQPRAESFAGHAAEIPPGSAEVIEQGGVLTLRYAGRRRIGMVVVLFLTGAVFTAIGVVLFAAGEGTLVSVLVLLVGVLLDAGAVILLVGRLEVTVKPGEVAVEKRGLFGARSWRLRRESIRSLKPVLSYSVNDRPYYTLFAETNDGRVPLGNALAGADVADAVARRICHVLGAPSSIIERHRDGAALPLPD